MIQIHSHAKKETASVFLGVISVVVLLALSGCFGVSDDLEGATSQDPEGLSDATKALHEAGFEDPYHDVEPTGAVKEFDIWMNHEAVYEPFEGREMWSFAFSDDPDEIGTVPGPEVRVTQGDTVRVHFHDPHAAENPGELAEGHTVHWHGVDVPWEMDGVPFVTQEVSTGEETTTYTYEFVAKQPGTYWYHCVFAFPAHLDSGMFGAFIVEPQDPSEDLPFDREETLIFHEADSQWLAASGWLINPNQDPDPDALPDNPFDLVESAENQARFLSDTVGIVAGDNTGEYLFSQGPRDYYDAWSPRYKPNYDTFMINGKSFPDTEPLEINDGETLRLRMINAGQMHKSLHLHGHKMLVTHNDGYPLAEPHWEDTLSLGPGERRDVYIQGTNPGIWSFHDHTGSSGMGTTAANDYAFPGGMMTKLVYDDFEHGGDLPKPEPSGATAGDYTVYADQGWQH